MAGIITILNGPNLDLLGTREPEIYGTDTLNEIQNKCQARAGSLGFELAFHQSNREGVLIELIHAARDHSSGIIINAAAYTHTSIAIADALKAAGLPVIELHLSNIFAREDFRHHSFISPLAKGVICGFGANGYYLALDAMAAMLNSEQS